MSRWSYVLAGLLVVSTPVSPAIAADTTPVPDAARAYRYLQSVCRLGPRPSGSRGMKLQVRMLTSHFSRYRGRVRLQPFDIAHPLSGKAVRLTNLVVNWHPDRNRRVLICCHYDTRPFPDRDPINPRGRFLGANDGGSGVALLMELAHHMGTTRTSFGVDFVFFDAEEFLFPRGNSTAGKFFLGSTHFATQYRDKPPAHRYVAGVLLDMIGDRDLQLYVERKSLRYAPKVTDGLWATARALGVKQFYASPRPKHDVDDDHVPLNRIAKIPTCDLIDFDYPHWHTTRDNVRACSGKSLAAVGRVVLKWLETLPADGP